MICKECAWEADGKKSRRYAICPVCERQKAVNLTLRILWAHKLDQALCGGSGEPVKVGHAACKGCDCRHLPVGSRT